MAEALQINRAAFGPERAATLRSEIHLLWVEGLIAHDPATAARMTERRAGLLVAVGSEDHPVILQFDLLTDALGAAQGGQRIEPWRRTDAERQLKALSGSATMPAFVGLNSLS